ncbi:MAG TPA: hypothetical protein VGI32_17765 [Steroidobacteraceae bacterium]
MTLPHGYQGTRIRGALIACFAVLSVVAGASSFAQATSAVATESVDQGALIRDLTLTRNVDGKLTVTMWMPDEFWRIALKSSGRMSDKGIADYIAVMHPYILVAVMDAQRGITAFRYTDADTLVGEASIEDSHGNTYRPLAPDAVAEDIRNLIQTMRPLLANMMGAMGQHMEFLVFPSADKGGHFIADPSSEGALTVRLGDVSMRYRLPIGSILPPALDPKTGESFPGSYHFNPYTGGKLVPRPTENHSEPAPKSK